MDPLSYPVTILILTAQEEEANRIITSLRNGGLAVRSTFAHEPERIEELAADHAFGLILCCDYDPAVDLASCMALYQELQLDVPLVVIASPETPPATLIAALRTGARDICDQGDFEHLQHVVARELEDFRQRRLAAHLKQRLEECEQRSRAVIDATEEAVAFIQEGVHVQVNPAYQKLFGFDSPDELEGLPLLDLLPESQRAGMRQTLRRLSARKDETPEELDLPCLRADGVELAARLQIAPSTLDGEPCLRVTVRQRSAQPAATAGGLVDAESGLPNRQAVMTELARRLGDAAAGRLGVIYVGIPELAELFRSQGPIKVLDAAAGFAAVLREMTPSDAFLGRISDDGFLLLLDQAQPADLTALAQGIRKRARLPLAPVPGGTGAPGCAVGQLLAQPGKDEAPEVLERVFQDYLLAATTPAAGPVPEPPEPSVTAGREPIPEATGADPLVAEIDRALEGEGFELFYQTIVSLKGDSQENYNVLLRLRDAQQVLHEAKEFVPAAAAAGRLAAIDRWVIQHAISEITIKRGQNHRVNFFINIGEQTLQDESLLILICDCLSDFQARGNWLTFQVSEEHARRHSAAFQRLNEGLKRVKCRIAVNGFGLGGTPEETLSHLKMDFVKFAPELAAGLVESEAKQRRLVELTKMARDQGVRSIVTGVEDARTLTVLWTAGIDYVQGNFLQPPSATIDI